VSADRAASFEELCALVAEHGTPAQRALFAAVARGECELDRALGLVGRQGARSHATIERLRRRDELHRAAVKFCKSQSTAGRAKEICDGRLRYADSAGKRERGDAECPPRRRGTVFEIYWELERMGCVPLSEHAIRKLLSQVPPDKEQAVLNISRESYSPTATDSEDQNGKNT
jgi:hypothetical protein